MKSTLNGNLVVLEKNESIIDKIIEDLQPSYPFKPSICFFDEQ
jgi:hypothetical protein